MLPRSCRFCLGIEFGCGARTSVCDYEVSVCSLLTREPLFGWHCSSFPLELHLVHKSDDGKLAVIGFLFEEGGESEFLAQVRTPLPPVYPLSSGRGRG